MSRTHAVGGPRIFSITAAGALAVALGLSLPAQARITKIELNPLQAQNPAYAGMSFGSVGTYEKISGIATGEVDPADPKNAVIVDIAFAPKNANGKVEYAVNFVIVKPTDLSKGNHKLLAFLPNRGGASATGMQGGTAISPTANLTNPGNAFLFNAGYSILLQGWEFRTAPYGMVSDVIARNPDGSSITGPSMEELVVDNDTTVSSDTNFDLSYPAADTSTKVGTKLTWRLETAHAPTVIPDSGWEYVGPNNIRLLPAGTLLKRGLYEFTYTAKDPLVSFLGAAALRDLMSFLKNEVADDFGTPNPLAGHAEHIYTNCNSQPCRTMRDVWHWGFNEDESGRKVVDGVLNYIAGGDGLFWNYRFAQSGRTKRHHIARHYPEGEFPFSNTAVFNPFTGKTQGRFDRCNATGTCPKVFEIFSENEYYSKGTSNLHTFMMKDIPDHPLSRNYLLASFPHGAGSGLGICQQFGNPLANAPIQRAMLVALDEWVINGTPPPASRVPKVADGTLVRPTQAAVGFPNIPARPAVANVDTGFPVFFGRMTTGDVFNYGPRYAQGIMDILPPILKKESYTTMAPKTDVDGNGIAGVRVPDVAVPIATYTGWSNRARSPLTGPVFGPNDGCDGAGQKIPFARTLAERTATGDPRLSLEERYSSHQDYVDKVTAAANALKAERFLLDADVAAYIATANAAAVP